MSRNSEAIRLAEASDWKGLERLIEMAPEYARARGDYGMLPIHWACTESHVPVALLAQLLAAFPDGAKIKNDAELLPLHIAIRARVAPEWLEKLLDVYPSAVHVDAPEGVSVLELAEQVGLHKDGLKILQRAVEDSLPENDVGQHHANSNNDEDDDDEPYQMHGDHPERDANDLGPLKKKQSLLRGKGSTLQGLPANFGRGSNSNNNTPVSPAASLRSICSAAGGGDNDDDETNNQRLPSAINGRMVSPTSSVSSNGSANTAPIPRTPPPLQSRLNASSFRKHSLDFHAHAAAAAAATRQHQELLRRARGPAAGHNGNSSSAGTPPQRSMSMLSGRHQSLPIIPSFEHVKFTYPHAPDPYDDQSSEEDDDDAHFHHNNLSYDRHESARGSGGARPRAFESPPEWKRDDECSICRASFGMFKHRHHCRNCGKSICSQHSADKKILMESKGFTTPQRVCVTCYAMITHKQTRELATLQPSPLDGVLQGAKITGPVAAFHQQMQQQQHQHPSHQNHSHSHPQLHPHVLSARRTSATALTGISSPGSASQRSARSSVTAAPAHASPGAAAASNGAKDPASDQWAMQAQLNELRTIVSFQQAHIEKLTQTNMQMQQQVLEQEELKAETMLLITQLMTRVSMLELNRHNDDDDDDDDDDKHNRGSHVDYVGHDGDDDDDDGEVGSLGLRHPRR